MPLLVLTGGPCSGKTTLLAALAARGFKAVSESAAECIAEMRAEEISPEVEFEELQRRVFARQSAKEDLLLADKHAEKETIFLDRSLIDVCAYFWARGLNVPADIYARAAKARYEKVFLLALLPDKPRFENGIRYERDPDQAFRIQAQLRKAYSAFGYSVIDVPVAGVEERVEFVLSQINS